MDMAKYSTGGVSSNEEGSCELCGAEGRPLRTEQVAGATLAICPECRARHAEGGKEERERDEYGQETGTRDPDEPDRQQQAVRNTVRMNDARRQDSEHWESGADYEGDPLPYLVRGYGDRLAKARAAADLGTAELAGELGTDEADIIAIERGRATKADIGGSLVAALEERLNITLSDDT
jgi:ribosome-binding protein aMBF1 (putative translation factor)